MVELPAAFGKYFLTEKIATGGMAEIFLGKLIGPGGFEKQLIIKQIHPELGGKREFVDMFVAEAKTLVSLSHGNIVPVYELGMVDDVYFLAMEYIDGPTLAALQAALRERSTDMAAACVGFIAAEVCKGLDYAHRKGVIHRDLSPRNVMISREGEVKLVDFGIAVREEADRTRPTFAGSYPYMSPEQVRGQELSGQSDVFSLGVLLWEMLTGEELFARKSADETLRAITDAEIQPPSLLRPDVPRELERICVGALARERSRRHATAGEVLAALNHYLYSLPEPMTAVVLSELVARHCPPGGRRHSTATVDPFADGHAHTVPLPGRGPDTGAAEGQGTAVMERTRPMDPGSRDRRRSSTVRTFATHRQFQEVLARATPLLPLAAITDDAPAGGAAARPVQGRDVQGRDEPAGKPGPDAPRTGAAAGEDAPRTRPRARLGAWWTWLLGAGLLVVVAAFVAWSRQGTHGPAGPDPRVLAAGRDAGPDRDAAPLSQAREIARDGGDAATPPPRDAAPAMARGATSGTTDAAPRTTGPGRNEPGKASLPDAGLRRSPADAARAAEPGTLKVGANPWAEVHVDGRKLGRAPNAWPVSPGKHTVEVKFPVPGREETRTFEIEVQPGQTTSLGVVDFSAAAPGP